MGRALGGDPAVGRARFELRLPRLGRRAARGRRPARRGRGGGALQPGEARRRPASAGRRGVPDAARSWPMTSATSCSTRSPSPSPPASSPPSSARVRPPHRSARCPQGLRHQPHGRVPGGVDARRPRCQAAPTTPVRRAPPEPRRFGVLPLAVRPGWACSPWTGWSGPPPPSARATVGRSRSSTNCATRTRSGSVPIFVTAYCGFRPNDDEYKVMGLAPYGTPRFTAEPEALLRPDADGSLAVDAARVVRATRPAEPGVVTCGWTCPRQYRRTHPA